MTVLVILQFLEFNREVSGEEVGPLAVLALLTELLAIKLLLAGSLLRICAEHALYVPIARAAPSFHVVLQASTIVFPMWCCTVVGRTSSIIPVLIAFSYTFLVYS